MGLLKSALKAGYNDKGTIHRPNIGIPQGSVLSPLLCNIYMHKLDEYVTKLQKEFDSGFPKRKRNPAVRRLQRRILKGGNKEEIRKLQDQLKRTPGTLTEGYRKMTYVRYVDDFIVGIAGKYQDALEVKTKIKEFLEKDLKLVLNENKTHIRKFSSNKVKFLGTLIRGTYRKEKPRKAIRRKDQKYRSLITPNVSFHAPIKKIFEKSVENGYFRKDNEKFIPRGVGRLVNLDHADIVTAYNEVTRGVLNYYSFVDNRKSLGS